MNFNSHLIKLPMNGRLLVFTDLHGNIDDYEKYLSKWDSSNPDCHIVIAGDFIHSIYKKDFSIDILDDIISKSKRFDNFHPLLGNHEWCHITDANLFKGYVNQKLDFERKLVDEKGSLEPYLTNYVKFFKSLAFYLQCDNGVFVAHAGPARSIKSVDDYNKLIEISDYHNDFVLSALSARPHSDYDEDDVSVFLRIVESNVMVVGHTVVDAYKEFGNQMILSSSFGTDNKMYLDIDLTKEVNNMEDLKSFLRKLDD